ncbi:MAG: VOC family protein [Mucilaginibacter sp.]
MDSLSPNIFVNNMNETIDFYRSIGFQLVMTVPEAGADFDWAMLMNGDVTVMFQTFASLGDELPAISRQNGGSLLFYIKLKKIREFFELIKDKVTVLKGIKKTFYGATELSILDNNNYVLTFAEDE